MRSLAAAISFLTRIPVGRAIAFDSKDVARAAGWFPLVGLLLGAIAAGVAYLLRGHLPFLLVAVILVTLEALLTGALHFDGLADTADGFGGGKDRESMLRIMRDHAIGSYGGTAIALLVALKVIAYAALLEGDRWFPAILIAPVLGRWSILLLTAWLPYARETASVVREMGVTALVSGTVIAAAAVSPLWRRWLAGAAVVVVSAAFGFYCNHKIGGITGDTLGANLQLCECAVLVVFLWRI